MGLINTLYTSCQYYTTDRGFNQQNDLPCGHNHNNINNIQEDANVLQLPMKYRWSDNSNKAFCEALEKCQDELSEFSAILGGNGDPNINDTVLKFNQIVHKAAHMGNIRTSNVNIPCKKNKRKNHRKWFDGDCRKALRSVKSMARRLPRNTQDDNMLQQYTKEYKLYKKLCKTKQRQYKAKLIGKLDELHGQDPAAFWGVVNQLKEPSTRNETHISPNTWLHHFENLMSCNRAGDPVFDKHVVDFVKTGSNTATFSELDYRVSESEVRKAVGKLKNGKSAGADSIPNEMLKSGKELLIPPLTRIFNLVLSLGTFPDIWNNSILTTIYKKGDPYAPENYRGICIASCVGKLFCQILKSRLEKYTNDHNLNSKYQAGFKAKHRTTDHYTCIENSDRQIY